VPTHPFHRISIDLVDFSGKPAFFEESKPGQPRGVYKCILSLIDNYSRKLFTRAMKNKEAETTTEALESIMKQIVREFPRSSIAKKKPGKCLMDDGSEFKGDKGKGAGTGEFTVSKTLAKYNVAVHRILGGHPEQNALVERSNKGIKMLMAKMNKMNQLGWVYNYELATKRCNEHLHRGISMAGGQSLSPDDAVKHDTKAEFKSVKNAIQKNHRPKGKGDSKYEMKRFKVGDPVRLKLNKNILQKSSDVSWSSETFKVKKVIPSVLTMAEKCVIDFDGDEEKEKHRYTRHDLQLVEKVDEMPDQFIKKIKKERPTRQAQTRLSVSKGEFTQEKEKFEKRKLRERKKDAKEPPAPIEVNSVMLKKQPKRKGAKKPVPNVERTHIIEAVVQRRKRPKTKKWELEIKWKGHKEKTWELESDIKADLTKEQFKELIDEFKKTQA